MSVLSRLTSVPHWARRPVLPAILLAVAVAVSVAKGQPPPADRASGVSVPVRAAVDPPPGLGRLLLVSDGALTTLDVDTGVARPVRLPRNELALRAWHLRDVDVVLTVHRARASAGKAGQVGRSGTAGKEGKAGQAGRAGTPGTGTAAVTPGASATPSAVPSAPATDALPPVFDPPLGTAPPAPALPDGGDHHVARRSTAAAATASRPATSAYALTRRGAAVRLGAASAVVPAPDGRAVWLLRDDVARLVRVDGHDTGRWVRVPPNFWLVGATREGPVATVGGARPMTVLLPATGALPHWLANAEALDVADGLVLLREDHRLGTLRIATGERRWMPPLSAIQITGPGTLSPGSGSFAVQARVNDHARLVVGPVGARSGGQLQVVALEGGRALDHPPAPVWTEDDRVLAVRPDGRTVLFRQGDALGSVLGAQFQADGLATVRPADATVAPGSRRPR
jgi:hypothetical protein